MSSVKCNCGQLFKDAILAALFAWDRLSDEERAYYVHFIEKTKEKNGSLLKVDMVKRAQLLFGGGSVDNEVYRALNKRINEHFK